MNRQALSRTFYALLALTVGAMLLTGWPYAFAITAVGASLYGGILLLAIAFLLGKRVGKALDEGQGHPSRIVR